MSRTCPSRCIRMLLSLNSCFDKPEKERCVSMSGSRTWRHSEKGIDRGIYENILRNKSALLMEICITFTCFQTLRPRKRGSLHETGFSSTSIDTTLMIQILPNRQSLDFDYLKSRQMQRYAYNQNSQMNLASSTGNPN